MRVKTNRRKFLGFLAASPLAAKQVAEEQAMKLSGLNVGVSSSLAGEIYPSPDIPKSKIFQLLKKGIPDFKLRQLKDRSRTVHTIDPSIASLKSVSLSGKIKMQQTKNFKTEVSEFKRYWNPDFQKAQEKFQEEYGWWL